MLTELKKCTSIYDISDLLGFRAKYLAYILYTLKDSQKYTEFCISKKNGKTRQISAPTPRLKNLQRRLSDVLYDCRKDIIEKNGATRSFGFEKHVGIYENALSHRKRRWVFNVDISDFFPSINFGRVRGFFIANSEFSLDPAVATIIAQISCFSNSLPQGSPSSPVIANFICGSLDYRLARLAKRNRCNYSRYADDITFSTNERQFPEQLAQEADDPQGWRAGETLTSIIEQSGFKINDSKTRMSKHHSRQQITGLIANRVINSPIEIRKFCRSSVHRLLNNRPIRHENFIENFGENCEDRAAKSPNALLSLESKLVHNYFIRNRSDNRKGDKKFHRPNATASLLTDFYIYKYFLKPGRPIIVTEGLTDILYLKSALKSSQTSIQHLCVKGAADDAAIICDFFNFPKLPGKLLGLTGGTGNIKQFLEKFSEFKKRIGDSLQSRSVIFLVDNDSGSEKLFRCIESKYHTKIDFSNDSPFHSFWKNMAVVKTPTLNAIKTDIEDFVDPNYTISPVNGRIFTRKENYDPTKNFGKMDLAKIVYDNRKNIDFTNFFQILQRISDGIDAL